MIDQSEIEKFRATGASQARMHANAKGAARKYRPLSPSNAAFCVGGRCNVTKYANYLIGYRREMRIHGIEWGPIPVLSEVFEDRPDHWFTMRPELYQQEPVKMAA